MPDPSPAVEVFGLVARDGERTVLEGVDMTVARGEVHVILGGSGCGKSTLLKHALGLLPPAGGEVRLLGEDLTRLSEAGQVRLRTRIGMLFQYGALLGSLTVGENAALPLTEHTDLPPAAITELVRRNLALVDLSHAEHLLPSELSGGMRKRAALARAIALDPEVLFCDEPSAGLDPLTSAEVDELLLRLRDRFGMAVVVVTHELMSIERIADRVTMLSGGRVLADGTLDEVRATPDPEVQAFFARQPAGEVRAQHTALEALAHAQEHESCS